MSFSKLLLGGSLALALCAVVTAAPVRAEISEKDFNAAMDKYLNSDKGQEAFVKFMDTMQRKQQEMAQKKQMEMMEAKLEEQFKNPVQVDIGNSTVRGPASAKITLIEFSDFQCPYCKRGKETVDEIMKAYPNDVKFVFKNLPLPFHPQAKPAAKAALAAGKQGKYWEMHDSLFANQEKLGTDFFMSEAKRLGLDTEKFKADMESAELDAQIKADSDQAQKLGIGGTPSFVVSGVEVRGAYPVEHFKKIIDRLLAKK